jgi:hypothetical protein
MVHAVSKKKARKTVVRKPIPAGVHTSRPGPVLSPEQRHVVNTTRDLPQFTEPFDAEMTVASALTEAAAQNSTTPFGPVLPGMSFMYPDGLPKPKDRDLLALTFDGSGEHALWTAVIEHAAAVPSRRGLALLRTMAVVIPDTVIAKHAASQADTLARSGTPEPTWSHTIHDLRPGDCWSWDNQSDSGHVVVMCSYWYQDKQHAFSVLIDHMMGGVAKNVTPTIKISEMLTQFPMTPIPQAEAHNLMAQAYELTYQHPHLPVDPDIHRTRFLIYRRLHLDANMSSIH